MEDGEGGFTNENEEQTCSITISCSENRQVSAYVNEMEESPEGKRGSKNENNELHHALVICGDTLDEHPCHAENRWNQRKHYLITTNFPMQINGEFRRGENNETNGKKCQRNKNAELVERAQTVKPILCRGSMKLIVVIDHTVCVLIRHLHKLSTHTHKAKGEDEETVRNRKKDKLTSTNESWVVHLAEL